MKKLKVLALSQLTCEPNWDQFYLELGENVSLDWRKLNRTEQRNLKKYFSHIDLSQYDRIFLDLRFKQQLRQRHFIATLTNLVEYEHDATQNYSSNSKYKGAWSKYYSTLSSFRAINSGVYTSKRLTKEGFDSCFVPKGYNEKEISNLNIERDISLGFIGRTERGPYTDRKNFLNLCVSSLGLQILRTNPGNEYNKTLNRIRIFISADIGLEEYMIKNFEALAAGCILCCYRQGYGEEDALGLVDKENVILYSSLQELQEKISWLKNNPEQAGLIAVKGQVHAEQQFSTKMIAQKTADALLDPIIQHRELNLVDRILATLGK